MAASDIRKNLNLFVDGRGYAGQVESVSVPKLQLKTEDFRGGGMNMPIELTLGMEKLEGSFVLVSYDRDVLSLFGVTEGNTVPFVVREALESYDGTITPAVHTMRGKIKEIDSGESKPDTIPKLTVHMALNYYKLVHGTTTVHEIDAINMIQVVNGTDTLTAMRSALGM